MLRKTQTLEVNVSESVKKKKLISYARQYTNLSGEALTRKLWNELSFAYTLNDIQEAVKELELERKETN